MAIPHAARLEVNREALRSALRLLGKRGSKRYRGQKATLQFEDGHLVLSLDDIAAGAEASGSWDGEVILDAQNIWALAQAIPASDPVIVEVEGELLRVGTFRVSCEWSGPGRAPLKWTPRELLILAEEGPKAVAMAGADELVEAVRRDLDGTIGTIQRLLAPYGVSPVVVRDWVVGLVVGEATARPRLATPQLGLGLQVTDDQLGLGDD